MYPRHALQELKHLAQQFRVISLTGPRQAGKTTLCKIAFPTYHYVSLEDPDNRLFALEDPRGFLEQYRKYAIFDEIQRVPSLLSYIQGIVDTDNLAAQFILTGSHQLALNAALSQTLAGRTAMLTLYPLTFDERYAHNAATPTPEELILNGFMPGKHKDQIDTTRFYRSYYQTYVEKDVQQLIQLKDKNKFDAFVRLCAGRVGQLLNASSLATDVGVSSNTINDWLSVLESSFILFRLPPYFDNFGKRIIKAPKLYFVDSGLACWLLGIETVHQLQRDPLKGHLYENFVVVEALKSRANRGLDSKLFFFRDSHGNEVDLVIPTAEHFNCFEIKSAKTWQACFIKGLEKFEKISAESTKKVTKTVIYAGSQERNTHSYRLINHTSSTKYWP